MQLERSAVYPWCRHNLCHECGREVGFGTVSVVSQGVISTSPERRGLGDLRNRPHLGTLQGSSTRRPTPLEPQRTRGARSALRDLATRAAAAGKILMIWIEPSGLPDVFELRGAIAANRDLKAAFDHGFLIHGTALLDRTGIELEELLHHPFRDAWPGVAFVTESGELLSVIDPETWKSNGRWDAERLKRFAAFRSKPAEQR